jgi:predicted nucleic acid-binding protein
MELLTKGNLGTNGVNENRFVLDTNAVIFLIAKGSNIPANLETELNKADLFISVITEIEMFAKPGMPPDEEKRLRAFISDKLSVIELTGTVKNETIKLRRTVKLKLPDCIVAASAIAENAVLLTADGELLRLNKPDLNVRTFGT